MDGVDAGTRGALVRVDGRGLYCAAGDFHIDPWRPVERALITHAHADHARAGHRRYLATAASAEVLKSRIPGLSLQTLGYGEAIDINGVRVSFHPAGHVLGSAQVRLEHRGEVWVVSGDYKTGPDRTCAPFEPVRCHTFITESTFGLPVYRWPPEAELFGEIDRWWAANAQAGRASVLFCYSFGKAQRILAGIDASIGPIVCHGAIDALNDAYRRSGVALPATRPASDWSARPTGTGEAGAPLVLAPPSTGGSSWLRRFGDASDAFASGWMQLRGARRRRGVDRGFALSDHADWPGLLQAIGATGAERVLVTHGASSALVRWLVETGLQADTLRTEYADETGEDDTTDAADPGATGGPAPR